MPQLTDEQYEDKAIKELSKNYLVPEDEVRERIHDYTRQLNKQEVPQEARATLESSVWATTRDFKAEVAESERYGYKVG